MKKMNGARRSRSAKLEIPSLRCALIIADMHPVDGLIGSNRMVNRLCALIYALRCDVSALHMNSTV